jgi:hypothetical protein
LCSDNDIDGDPDELGGELRQEMFPVAEAGLGERLAELGDEMAARKRELETSGAQKVKRAIKKAVRKIA